MSENDLRKAVKSAETANRVLRGFLAVIIIGTFVLGALVFKSYDMSIFSTSDESLIEEAEHRMHIKAQKATPETFFKDRGVFVPDSLTHEELMNFYERTQKNEELEAAFLSIVRHMRKRLVAHGRTGEVYYPVGLGDRSYVVNDGGTIWIDIHASDEEIIRELALPQEAEAPEQK